MRQSNPFVQKAKNISIQILDRSGINYLLHHFFQVFNFVKILMNVPHPEQQYDKVILETAYALHARGQKNSNSHSKA